MVAVQTLASFGFEGGSVVSRGGLLGPISLTGTPTVSTQAFNGTSALDFATPVFLQLPQTAVSYMLANDGFTIEGYMFLPTSGYPSAYWSWLGLFSGFNCEYLMLSTWSSSLPPMVLDSFSGGGGGSGNVPRGWIHVFLTYYRDQIFVGFNGMYWSQLASGNQVFRLSRFPTLDRVGVAFRSGTCPNGYTGSAAGIRFDELRITAGVRYLNNFGTGTGEYAVPAGPLVDDGTSCTATPAALADGAWTCSAPVVSGARCSFTCNGGFTARGSMVCQHGAWVGSVTCAGTACDLYFRCCCFAW
jgi:hypothetical protein